MHNQNFRHIDAEMARSEQRLRAPAPRAVVQRDFPATRAALVIYDAGAAARQALWDRAESSNDVFDAEAADQAALQLLQEAFHQDTAEINSMDHCRLVDIGFMRRMAQG